MNAHLGGMARIPSRNVPLMLTMYSRSPTVPQEPTWPRQKAMEEGANAGGRLQARSPERKAPYT